MTCWPGERSSSSRLLDPLPFGVEIDTVRAVRLLAGRLVSYPGDVMADNERARLLSSYDDQLAELRRYL